METAPKDFPEIANSKNFYMRTCRILLRKVIFLYIYLYKEILYSIKTGKLNSTMLAEEGKISKSPEKNLFLKLGIRAFLTTFLVFFTIVYLHQGSLIFNADGSSVFNTMAIFELTATFVFLFSVFLVHRGISLLINSRPLAGYHPMAKGLLEAFLVIVSAIILIFLTILVPFYIIYPEIEVTQERIRFNYIFIAVITLFFYYFVERERSKKRLQEEMLRAESLQKENFKAQLQSLKSQVSPHFLFNSLNVLGSLIQQDREKATEFTERLSDLYRAFLANYDRQLISLREELEVVKDYIYLLETRFGQAVIFDLQIDQEKTHLLLPPGSLQMLIENAIKHNGSTRKRPLKISVATRDDLLVVQNNRQPRREEITSSHFGLKNIKNRYGYFSDRQVEIFSDEKEFKVHLPLLKVEAYANSDH